MWSTDLQVDQSVFSTVSICTLFCTDLQADNSVFSSPVYLALDGIIIHSSVKRLFDQMAMQYIATDHHSSIEEDHDDL